MSEFVSARALGLGVIIGGVPINGAQSFELIQESPYSAARFRLTLAMNAPGTGAGFYASMGPDTIRVDIRADVGLSAGSLTFEGQIDSVMIDVGAGVALVSGRDFTARLIDAEVSASFSNQTASAIANQFAQAAGLTAQVTTTTTPIGQYYELAHTGSALALHSRHPTRWDLLIDLAELEDFVVAVTGSTFVFGPKPSTPPLVLSYQRDLMELTIDRAVGLLEPTVTIKSWNPRLQGGFTATAGSTSANAVTLVKPNLTEAQVTAYAQREQARLAAQSVLLRVVMPGEFTLAPSSLVQLQDAGPFIDGLYRLRSVERRIDRASGFIQRIEATKVG